MSVIEFWKTGENPITCYRSKSQSKSDTGRGEKKEKALGKTVKKSITVEDENGEKEIYPSVKAASDALKFKYSTMCGFLNGRCNNPTGLKIYKTN